MWRFPYAQGDERALGEQPRRRGGARHGRLATAAIAAIALGATGAATGLLISANLDLASGATIILTLGASFFVALAVRRKR